ncbi:MAG TPA: hypothetical protein VH796_08065 [Nitrososphaeraceae archaeon]|jgi:hypothetical protein
MVNETTWGLIGVAFTISASALAIYIELHKSRGQVGRMLRYLRNSAMGNVDEKIAVLFMHSNGVPNWIRMGINVDNMISQMSSDLSSLARVRNNMSWEQWVELHRALRVLIETMETNGLDTARIRDMQNALR